MCMCEGNMSAYKARLGGMNKKVRHQKCICIDVRMYLFANCKGMSRVKSGGVDRLSVAL